MTRSVIAVIATMGLASLVSAGAATAAGPPALAANAHAPFASAGAAVRSSDAEALAAARAIGNTPMPAPSSPQAPRPSIESGLRPLPDLTRLDPGLLDLALAGGPDTVAVLLGFADKGEQGPADLAARLAAAAAALDPHARARRERAHVTPLVDYRDLPVHAPYIEALRARGLRPYAASRWFNHVALHVPAARLAELTRLPFTGRVEKMPIGRVSADPIGSLTPPPIRRDGMTGDDMVCTTLHYNYGQTVGPIKQLNLPAVHDSGYIGTGVRVCMLDDGFPGYRTHEALAPINVPAGWTRDFVDGDSDPTNGGFHGSATLGCAGGDAPGIYLGSGFGATFMLARTEVDVSEHQVEMVYWGMGAEWADSLGADLISSSLGYNLFDAPDTSYTYADMNGHTTIVTRAAEIAASKGILVVNAAGNEGSNSWHYIIAPADVDGDSLIAAAAVDSFGAVASFSSRGPTSDGRIKPDLAARGVSVPCVISSGGYSNLNGTSFATPLLAGMCACIMQARPSWTPRMVISALKMTASRAGNPDSSVGWGIPNALAALRVGGVAVPPVVQGPALQLIGQNPVRFGSDVLLRVSPIDGSARLKVVDLQGRVVRSIVPCDTTVHWDGRTDSGGRVAAGVYFVRLEAARAHRAVRVVMLP